MTKCWYAHTPDPSDPNPDDEPHKVPVEPPAEPPNPNPVHLPPGGAASDPDTIARRTRCVTPDRAWREHPIRLPHRERHPVSN